MIAKITSACVVGVEARPVTVEVDVSNGLPGLQVVGLPDKSVEESRERVRAALRANGFPLPARRVVVNLAPADLRKAGSGFDLAMAVGIMRAAGQLPEVADSLWVVGELALDGAVRVVPGCLPIARLAAQSNGTLIVPAANAGEAALAGPQLTVLPVRTLAELIAHCCDEARLTPAAPPVVTPVPSATTVDLSEVSGQAGAKRALEVAAAGNHNLLLTGPPGTGKTLLAKALPGILPPLTLPEVIEVTTVYSVVSALSPDQPYVTTRPFRGPHHAVSVAGLIGGGNPPGPGELSLAHRGVLFLDELPQFPPHTLDAIRTPLEDRQVTVARSGQRATFPTDCVLVASQNPCPCGYASDPVLQCSCPPAAAARYASRVSGPIRDRFDLTVEVARLQSSEFAAAGAESSATVRQRVAAARDAQTARQGEGLWNAALSNTQLRRYCELAPTAEQLLLQATDRWGLSVRAHHRIIKVARTIADLDGAEAIVEAHLAEALGYRPMPVGQPP